MLAGRALVDLQLRKCLGELIHLRFHTAGVVLRTLLLSLDVVLGMLEELVGLGF